MENKSITCAHCSGTGTCRLNDTNQSCSECIAHASSRIDSDKDLSIVSCSKCDGLGKRDIQNELWHKQTAESMNQSAKNPLPHFAIKEEETTKRLADSRRFKISGMVIISGAIIITAGVLIDYVLYPDMKFLIALLPIGSSLISGALGAYVGGERQSQRSIDQQKENIGNNNDR